MKKLNTKKVKVSIDGVEKEIDLKPCFNCGDTEKVELIVSYIVDDDLNHVFCFNCGCAGPATDNARLAVKGWNTLFDSIKNVL